MNERTMLKRAIMEELYMNDLVKEAAAKQELLKKQAAAIELDALLKHAASEPGYGDYAQAGAALGGGGTALASALIGAGVGHGLKQRALFSLMGGLGGGAIGGGFGALSGLAQKKVNNWIDSGDKSLFLNRSRLMDAAAQKFSASDIDMLIKQAAIEEAILQQANITQDNMADANAAAMQALVQLAGGGESLQQEAAEGEIPPELLQQIMAEQGGAQGAPQGGEQIPPEILAQLAAAQQQEQAAPAQAAPAQAAPAQEEQIEQKVASAYFDILNY